MQCVRDRTDHRPIITMHTAILRDKRSMHAILCMVVIYVCMYMCTHYIYICIRIFCPLRMLVTTANANRLKGSIVRSATCIRIRKIAMVLIVETDSFPSGFHRSTKCQPESDPQFIFSNYSALTNDHDAIK